MAINTQHIAIATQHGNIAFHILSKLLLNKLTIKLIHNTTKIIIKNVVNTANMFSLYSPLFSTQYKIRLW
jgi:hypothetical protein